jgi:hypothetical protein
MSLLCNAKFVTFGGAASSFFSEPHALAQSESVASRTARPGRTY